MLSEERLATAARVRLVVGRLSRRIRQRHPVGLTASQLSTLATVERHQPVRVSELAELEDVSAPTMTRLVAGLVDARLLVRRPDPDDGRSVRVSASAAGARRLRELRRQKTTYLARQIERLSDDEYASLVKALPALEALLVEDPGA